MRAGAADLRIKERTRLSIKEAELSWHAVGTSGKLWLDWLARRVAEFAAAVSRWNICLQGEQVT
eukprot:9021594-Pyramimonas_sp.AAC.1